MQEPRPRPASEPPADCARCPRLQAFRTQNRAANPDWFNAPVPSFGDRQARLLIVGLAPGLQGANRTGRPFTGDYAGELLYQTLLKFGFAEGHYLARPDDGLRLRDAIICNAVRCVPPQNKPTTTEINSCRAYLEAQISSLPALRVILALGKIAHDSVLRAAGLPMARYPFAHGGQCDLPWQNDTPTRHFTLIDSYHCSRYNTNTGRLTKTMFEAVFAQVVERLKHNPTSEIRLSE